MTEAAQSRREAGRDRDRIVNFGDSVIAIANPTRPRQSRARHTGGHGCYRATRRAGLDVARVSRLPRGHLPRT
jgi:hypothetical protein